ncbi:MAG: hypothetical protein IJZ42_05070 [Lachnospiraceae bacterium]|nr:hypothetical protein [Lachnospiraceae bacterium]
MRLEEQYDEESSGKGTSFMLTAVACVAVFLVAVLGIVLFVNRESLFQNTSHTEPMVNEASEDITDNVISGSTLVSDDLDIWDDYPSEEPEEEEIVESVSEQSSEDDPSEGGTKTLVTFADGSEQWYSISKYLPQNEYEETGFVLGNGRMSYYVDGNKESYVGMDISKYQGYIDFNEVKKDGIDFVIIKLGSRGYSTGQLTVDDYFQDNMKRAMDADLEVGISFSSQAITVEEAVEEAEFVLQYMQEYDISYPIIFEMEHIVNDTARIDDLTKEEKTRIAETFLDKIEEAGYNVMLSGDKAWLFSDINYAALSAYDIRLEQEEDLPDYPYRFYMWQYTQKGTVDGVSGEVPLNICFIDYTIK